MAGGEGRIRQGHFLLKNGPSVVRIFGWLSAEVLRPPPAFLIVQASALLSPGNPRGKAGFRPPVPFFQTFSKSPQGIHPIPMLAPFLTGGDHDSSGEVGEADTRFGTILVLPSLSTGREGLHPTLGEEFLVRIGNGNRIGGVV
jgi:hypothetical protein